MMLLPGTWVIHTKDRQPDRGICGQAANTYNGSTGQRSPRLPRGGEWPAKKRNGGRNISKQPVSSEPRPRPLHGRADEAWWEAVYHEAAPRLYTFFYAHTSGNVTLAEDLVHETFVSAIANKTGFDETRGNCGPWLWSIARRRLADALRAQYRGGPELSFEEIERALAGACDSHPLPPEILERKETRLRIGSALASLSEPHRSVLRLKYEESRSIREIAGALGRSEKATESLLTRAREAFRSQFLESGDCEGMGE